MQGFSELLTDSGALEKAARLLLLYSLLVKKLSPAQCFSKDRLLNAVSERSTCQEKGCFLTKREDLLVRLGSD